MLATQNPIETEGTYALPEAQVDRFMLKVLVGYPTPTEEFAIVERMTNALERGVAGAHDRRARHPPEGGRRGLRRPGAVRLRGPARRRHPHARPPRDAGAGALHHVGASPRASINLILTGRALAFLRGRQYVLPEDVFDMAADVMRHRLVLSYEALSEDISADRILATILQRVPPPTVPLRELPRRAAPEPSSSASTGTSSGAWTACSRASTAACSGVPAWTSPGCASTSPATTSGTSTGTSPRARPSRTSGEYHEDREITAWFLLDLSPSVDFGTVGDERLKRTVLVDFVTTLARVLTRRGNRIGAIVDGGEGGGRSRSLRQDARSCA